MRGALSAFGDFEAGLVGVGKTANIEGRTLQKLGDDIEKLSLKIPVATGELLEIGQATGQLGVTGSANILKFTETIAKLGSASDLAGGEAAITLARILGLTGEATNTIDKLSSSLVALGNSAKASEAEIARVALEVSKGTAVFKVSSADVLGLSTTLKELGQQAEISRSTIQRTFQILQDVTEEGGERLKLLGDITGQTGEQFKQAFKQDSFGAFLTFIKGLGKTGDQSVKTLKSLGLNSLQINAVLPVLGKNFDLLEKRVKLANTAYVENVALNEEAAKAFATFNSAIQIVKNNLSFAFKIIGAELAPAFRTLGENIKEVAQSDSIRTFARALGVAFGFLADNIKLVIFALGTLTLRATIGLVIKLTSGVIGLANAFKAGAAATIAQAAGLNRVSTAANLFTASAATSAISIKNVGLRAKIAGTALFVLNSALALIGLNTSTISGLFGKFGNALSGVTGFIGRLLGSFTSILPGFLSLNTLSTAAGIAVRGLGAALGVLTGPIGLTIAAITGLIAVYGAFENTLIQTGDLNASIGSIVQATWEVATSQIGQNISAFVQDTSEKWTIFKRVTSEKFAEISSAIQESMSSSFESVRNFLQPAINIFALIRDEAREKFQGIVEAARDIVQPVIDKFNTIKRKIIESFTGAFSTIRKTFSNFVDKAFPGFVDKVVTKANELENAKNNIKEIGVVAENTAKQVKTAADTLKTDNFIGPQLPSGIQTNIPRSTDIKDFDIDVNSLDIGDKVKKELTESERLTEQFSNNFASTFKNGLESVFRNGRAGWADMLSGFRDLYFKALTELAARPILNALLGKPTTGFGGRTGGPVTDFFGTLFGANNPQPSTSTDIAIASQPPSVPVPQLKPDSLQSLGSDIGKDMATSFVAESEQSGGFLSSLTNIFSGSGGFLGNLGSSFSGLLSGLGNVFGLSGGGGLLGGLGSIFSSLSSNLGSIFSSFGGGVSTGGGAGGFLSGAVSIASSLFGFGGFGFAKGGAFRQGQLLPFAQGGLVSRPTVFPMANGGIGLMGEAGTEAILPLSRTSNGDLGVRAITAPSGGNMTIENNVNVTVNASGGSQEQNDDLAGRVATAVDITLQRRVVSILKEQLRSGGILNPGVTA